MDKLKRDKIVRSISQNFETRFLNNKGLISRNYPPNKRSILDNFDDIVPFLDYFGYSNIIFSQIELLNTSSYEQELAVNGILYSYKIDEYMGGLNHMAKKYKNTKTNLLLEDAIKKTFDYFIDDSQFSDVYNLEKRQAANFYSTWSAGFLETILEIKDNKFIGDVEKIMKAWINSEFFREFNLFPFRSSLNYMNNSLEKINSSLNNWCSEVPEKIEIHPNKFKNFIYKNFKYYEYKNFINRYLKSGHWAQLMKSNSTPVFTMIELYKLTKKEIWSKYVIYWLDSALDKFIDKNSTPFQIWYPNNKKFGPSLTAGFIFIDIICDIYNFVQRNDEWLEKAIKIANKCISWSWDNGLIPMSPISNINHIDNQIDFAISIRKLAELANISSLRKASFNLVERTLLMHNSKKGFYTHLYKDGSFKNLSQNTIDPKYNGLLLKGIIHLEEKNIEIYKNDYLVDLFKDR